MRRLVALLLLLLLSGPLALAQVWLSSTDGRFVVETASAADRERLPDLFAALRRAARELRQDWSLALPETVTLYVHPTLLSFQAATGQPWFVAAQAERGSAAVHLQRLRVLAERGSLEATVRHELFHLVQPAAWPRWRAEGWAMRFAGERPRAEPFKGLGEAELNALLAAPGTSEVLARAAATAWRWVGEGMREE